MALQVVLIVLGLAVLLIAGDLLVRGAVSVATALKIPALIVSLTIVAFGTSAPELFVSVKAVLAHQEGIAIGNIIGSNIANVLLVLGLPALIYPISAHVSGLRRHALIMLIATAAFAYFAYVPGALDRNAGMILLGGIVLYVGFMWFLAARGSGDPVIADAEEFAEREGVSAKTLLFLAGGLVGLPFGAGLLVDNGADLALALGVREELIGLTLVAIGTSLPELATVAAAALHKKADVAIGGVVGSNIFNLFAVGGAAGIAGTSLFDPASLRFDIPVMIATTLLLCAFIFLRTDIRRLSGLLMVGLYGAFLVALALQPGV